MRAPAAVVVTHDRPALLARALDALRAQTAPVDVVVVDNASGEETRRLLAARGDLHVVRNERNEPPAAAFGAGMAAAFARGADAAWLLDDDCEPFPDALAALLGSGEARTDRLLASMPVVAEDPARLANPLSAGRLARAGAAVRRRGFVDRVPDPPLPFDALCAPFNGLLVGRHAWARIGAPDASLGWQGDDKEYCLRAWSRGFPVRAIPASRVRHPRIPFSMRRALGRRVIVYDLPPWKRAASMRNNLRIGARHYPFPENLLSAARVVVEALATLRGEPLLHALDTGDPIARADELARTGEAALAVTLNLDHLRLVRRDPDFREACDGAALVVADGAPVAWAASLAGRRVARVTGSDLLHGLAARGRSIFLLGGGPGVAERAAAALRAQSANVAGAFGPPPHGALEDPAEVDRMLAAVAAARPEVVFAAFGSPRQEVFLWRNRARFAAAGARLLVGIGAALDFAAGSARRAPAWMRRAGLEWLFRLAREPRRLGPRYAADLLFLPRLFAETLCVRLVS